MCGSSGFQEVVVGPVEAGGTATSVRHEGGGDELLGDVFLRVVSQSQEQATQFHLSQTTRHIAISIS